MLASFGLFTFDVIVEVVLLVVLELLLSVALGFGV